MNIYYNLSKKRWEHDNGNGNFSWGKNQQLIEKINEPNQNSFSCSVNCKNEKLGPLIGILAGRRNDYSIVGNTPLFKKLQKEMMSFNGITIVFTLENINNDGIHGVLFLPDQNKWVKVKAPLPDLVYNRIPFRKMEQSNAFQEAICQLKNYDIPFFNPCFLDKFQLYNLLKTNPKLKDYLPFTELVRDEQQLFDFLLKYRSVYLKPTLSGKGKGIYQLLFTDEGEISFNGIHEQKKFQTFAHFWKSFSPTLSTHSYLVQEKIISSKIDNNRFDFRILAHYDQGQFHVTGVGIRKSEKQEITTHVPNGGSIFPYKKIQTVEHDQFFQMLVEELGVYLSESIGFFGEFSIDAGIDNNGKYIIYEVNSKPMSFDEEHIEKLKIKKLCKLFLQLTGFES